MKSTLLNEHLGSRNISELDKSLVMVNRTEEWQDDGIAYKPNTSHCEKVVETLNLQHEKTVISSVARERTLIAKASETALGSRCGPCIIMRECINAR